MSDQSRGAEQNILTRITPDMVARFTADGFWGSDTIFDCAQAHAAERPERIAVRDHGLALSYGDLTLLAERVCGRLRAAGLQAGDRVAAWMSSRCELAVLLLACARGGFVLCPSLHRNHTVGEISELLGRMRAKALFVETGFGADADRFDILSDAYAGKDLVVTVRLDPPAERTPSGVLESLGGAAASEAFQKCQASDIVYLAFTSGTTGEPKGVLHSSNTLLANARALASDWGFDRKSVSYTMSPLSHNLGFGALVLTLLVGGELILHDLPRGGALQPRLHAVGATFIFGVPAHAMDLVQELETSGQRNPLPSLRGFRISGAAVPAWVVERLAAFDVKAQSGYGMTEGCSHHYTLPSDPVELISSTSGRACPGYEVRIFAADDPNRALPPGEVGQIGGRGASLMMGYFDDQAATENAFNASGWFMTGDLGRVDERGYLTITGRLKEIIIRGGHNIHPAKIEQLAMRYPGVERAAAIGIQDERLGEKVCLVVMPQNGIQLDPDAMLAHLDSAGLSKFDMPEYYLNVREIPLSASGKMLKRALLPAIASGELSPIPIRFKEVAR